MIRLSSLPMIVSSWTSILLAAFFLALSVMIVRRTEERPRHYLFFSLMAASNGVFLGAFSVLVNASGNLDVLDASNRLTIIAATFTIALSLQFVAAFFDLDPPIPMWVVHVSCCVFALLCVIPSDAFLQKCFYRTCSYYVGLEFGPLFQAWGVFVVALSLYGVWLLVSVARGAGGAGEKTERRQVKVLIAASGLWLLTAMADCLTGVQVIDAPPMAWLGSFFTTVAIAGVLVSHIDSLYRAKGSLYQELIRDHLTGAFSRSYFELRLAETVRRAGRNPDLRAYLVILDIDEFKTVNDTWGHPAGDVILREIVSGLLQCVRDSDLVARIGGDEFAILLMDVGSDAEASAVVGRIQDRLRSNGAGRAAVTCSFGITSLSQQVSDGRSSEDFITAADDAMYEAKRAGRNTVKFRHLPPAFG